MTADQLLVLVTQIPFIVIAAVTIVRAILRPRRASIDIAILFSTFAVIIIHGWIADELNYDLTAGFRILQVSMIVAIPYLLLRVVTGFMHVSRVIQVGAAVAYAVIVVATIATGPDLSVPILAAIGLYFISLGIYASRAFVLGARVSRGVTARRMYAASAGSALIGIAILIAVFQAIFSDDRSSIVSLVTRMIVVGAGVSYFIAFSPPRFLRHAWQEPELRRILARVAVLPRLPHTQQIVRELEQGAAAATGATGASIGLWDQDRRQIRYELDGRAMYFAADSGIAGRAFSEQRPIFSENAPRDDPENAENYRAFQASAILAAPITAGDVRLGVLTVYAPRPPVFADDDLQLVQLLADQAAIILESRMLIDAATRVQAREQATRLRDDFLIAAAHDLRTPLTALIGRAQLIERRAMRYPNTPIDIEDIRRIGSDLLRLNALISELLDAARVEHGRLIQERQPVDLRDVLTDVVSQHDWSARRLTVDATSVVCSCDRTRIAQLIDNLLENAIKYSSPFSEVRVSLSQQGDAARLTVSDDGVGIPADDLPHIFERFHRAENVSTTPSDGLGLGLYICHGIVTEHGGRIKVQSTPGVGTTFTVTLPLDDDVSTDQSDGDRPAHKDESQPVTARVGSLTTD